MRSRSLVAVVCIAAGLGGCGGGGESTHAQHHGSAIEFARRTFGPRYGGAYIDRGVHPAVRRILVKDATDADRQRLAAFTDSPRVALESATYSYQELIHAKNAAMNTLHSRGVAFTLIAPRVIQQNVLVTTPHRLPANIRAAISRRAAPARVLFHVHPPEVVPPSTKPQPFTVGTLTATSRTIPIRVETGYCVGDPRPTISRVRVKETSSSVTLVAYLHTPGKKTSGVCAGVGYLAPGVAHLSRPLGDRTLLDGSTSPPTPVKR